ncbi:DUF4221 family protein [Algoriphagus sp. CAU 1675]|uniref:DUF4221 family protein n=1 Tax=Algoriphagus sp. CAU 1675 TaxID=3032597 RepID=UPI0023D98300|nr:DUF4221 family protein [Algoriphagus sp. CAU 1675]MDF2156375.1 DUF4221 family protein [Algoriphagus sp. CAU 1675]
MKNIISIFAFVVLVSCQEKSLEKTDPIQFKISIDTFSIDSQDHLLFVGYGIPKAKLSQDERLLFFYDYMNHSIETIDLEENKWIQSLYLEKEGPKGVMDRSRFDFIPLTDSTFRFFTQRNFIELNQRNELLFESPRFDSMVRIAPEKNFEAWAKLSSDKRYLVGLTSSFKQDQMLGWVDFKDSVYREARLDSMDYRKDLEIKNSRVIISSQISADFIQEKFFVYHADGIDVYRIDPKTGVAKFKDNSPHLFPRRKSGNFPKTAELGEFDAVFEKKELEISYRDLVFDQENQLFYRFAGMNAPETGRSLQYFMIFDKEMNLIHEMDVSEMGIGFLEYFVRKGRLYVRNKETEELEFFVLRIEKE